MPVRRRHQGDVPQGEEDDDGADGRSRARSSRLRSPEQLHAVRLQDGDDDVQQGVLVPEVLFHAGRRHPLQQEL